MKAVLRILIIFLSFLYRMFLLLLHSGFYSLRYAFRGMGRNLVLAFFAMIGLAVFVPFFTYVYFAKDLSTKDKIMNRNDTGIVLLDYKNRPFFSFYQAKTRDVVSLDKIPLQAQKAVIASEDRDFYNHPGFSLRSILRSLIVDVKGGDLSQGGSTITQQLVKNSLLSSRKDFLRKYQELVLAEEIERRYSKDEILSMYLNSVYFGKGSFGLEEAAQNYYGKHINNLDLAQSATLVALLPAPTRLGQDPDAAKLRRDLILREMEQQGYINDTQRLKAKNEQIAFVNTPDNMNSDGIHFALMVKDQLIKKYGEEKVARSGFKVHTSLNIDWQKYAERTVANQVAHLAQDNVSNGAAVVEDPSTGEIRALVGSADWSNNQFGKFNMALSYRQPGSSFKPIVYLKAFEDRVITPSSVLHDLPTAFKNIADPSLAANWRSDTSDAYYKPHDYDNKYRGNVLPRRALANSLNIPAVEVMSKVGVPGALEMAQRLGITSLDNSSSYGLSLVLGAGEVQLLQMTNVYATFANQGMLNSPTLIVSIDDKYGQTIYQYHSDPQPVVDPRDIYLITSILSDKRARAEEFGNSLTVNRPAAVKTGTTENYKDAWTLGYTPYLAIGAWVGNNNGETMDNIAGSLGAAPIWRQLIEHFSLNFPIADFTPPGGLVKLSICPNGQILRSASSSAQVEYFLPGTEPTGYCGGLPTPKPSSTPSPSPTSAPTPTPLPSPVKETNAPTKDKQP